jgi:hypothetical protein
VPPNFWTMRDTGGAELPRAAARVNPRAGQGHIGHEQETEVSSAKLQT